MTTDTIRTTRPDAASSPLRPGRVIAVLLAAAFVMILNETVMGVALPVLMDEFQVAAAAAQWLTTVYMLTMAVIIPLTGFVLQRFTTRTVYVTALVLFVIGTALAAVAPVFSLLVTARVLQAAGSAVMMPLLTTTILTFVPAERRGRTMGLVSIVIAVAPALGPSLSGFLITTAGWRSVFYVVLPIALVVLVVGGILVRNVAPQGDARFDLSSALLSTIAFGGLVYGLASIGEAVGGAHGMPPVIPILVGAIALALFVWRQLVLQRTDAAILDLRVFRSRAFSTGLILLVIAISSLFGALILLPLYLQNVLGLTPLDAGLIVLPGGILMGLAAPFVGAFYDRVGPRPLVIPGVAIVTVALGMLALLSPTSPAWFVIVIHLVLMIGLALTMTPLMTNALGSLPARLYPHGSAVVSTVQQLAGAAGTALFITLMTLGTASALAGGAAPVDAQAGGIHLAFVVGAVISVAAIVVSLFVRRAGSPDDVAAQAGPIH